MQLKYIYGHVYWLFLTLLFLYNTFFSRQALQFRFIKFVIILVIIPHLHASPKSK